MEGDHIWILKDEEDKLEIEGFMLLKNILES